MSGRTGRPKGAKNNDNSASSRALRHWAGYPDAGPLPAGTPPGGLRRAWIASVAGVRPEVATSWLEGRTSPTLRDVIRLEAIRPGLAAALEVEASKVVDPGVVEAIARVSELEVQLADAYARAGVER